MSRQFFTIATIAIVAVGAFGFFTYSQQPHDHMAHATPSLPPVMERINPQPQTGFAISIDDVSPGKTLTIAEASLQTAAKIVVYKDMAGSRIRIGTSALLPAGQAKAVSIPLQTKIVDGDVLVIELESSAGTPVQTKSGTPIAVKKPVGMIMMHFQSEY